MTLSLHRPLVVFDVETTGLSFDSDRVIEIAALKIYPDGTREQRCRRLNPEIPIPPEASQIHGITDEDVATEPTFSQAARAIFEFFDGCDLAGYNILRFDVPMLAAEFRRLEVRWPAEGVVTADAFRAYRMQEDLYSLAKAHEHYTGESFSDAHAALADVLATVRVIEAQAQRYNAPTMDALQKLTREPDWADAEGKLRWKDGEVVFAQGKHEGEPITKVPSGYLRWVLTETFPADTKEMVRAELKRREEAAKRLGARKDMTEREQFDLALDLVLSPENFDPQSGRGL